MVKMSDTRQKSVRLKTARRRGDLRLSVVAQGLPDYTSRQIQRWAAAGKIPGAYRLKRGHWRVRDCPAFRRWWKSRSPMPLMWAVTGYRPPGYGAKGLFTAIEKHRPMLDKLTKVVALKTRSGTDGWKIAEPDLHDPDHALWHGALTEMPAAVLDAARRVDKDALDVAVVAGELNARSERVTVATVAESIGISRATFYRRGYAKRLRICLRALTAQRVVKT